MKKYTFTELLAMRDHLREELKAVTATLLSYKGKSYDDYAKLFSAYDNHPYHEKLRVVKEEIQNRINEI